MLLPDSIPEFAVYDTYDSGTRKAPLFTWRGLILRLRLPFMLAGQTQSQKHDSRGWLRQSNGTHTPARPIQC